jgi:hypothetical protein
MKAIFQSHISPHFQFIVSKKSMRKDDPMYLSRQLSNIIVMVSCSKNNSSCYILGTMFLEYSGFILSR